MLYQTRVHAAHDGGGRNRRDGARLFLYYVEAPDAGAARERVKAILDSQRLREGTDYRVGDPEVVPYGVVELSAAATALAAELEHYKAGPRCPCGEMSIDDCAGECGAVYYLAYGEGWIPLDSFQG